jgi:O-antigen ligase
MKAKFLRWGLLLFAFLIPFGTKKFLFDFPTPFRNVYTSEYTSAFLYGSDILFLVCLFLLFFSKPLCWWEERFKKFKVPLFFLALFLIFSALSLFSAGYFNFGVYSFGRLALGILSALMVGVALKSNIIRFREIAFVISLAAVFEAVVGFLQFILSKSVGLWFLGETIFGPGTPGIAKVLINGTEFVRAYGTMPHANILAGFLVLGLLSFFYLFLKEEKKYLRVLEAGGIFVVLTGLFLTFSRSGWITALVSCLILLVWELFADKERRKRVIYLVSLLLVISSLLFVSLGWAISSRAHLSVNEGPVSDRWTYDRIGAELVLSHPFLGVGIGNQLFYTYRAGLFEKYDVNSLGQWQPIHNLYLMMGSEIGILGLISFIIFVILLISRSWNLFGIWDLEFGISATMFFALLLFGLFDHFLWDLELGRLMLWVTIGILLGIREEANVAF